MAWFHGQDQVVLMGHLTGQLLGFVIGVIATVFTQDFQRSAVHGFVYQGADAGGGNADILARQLISEHGFGHGAAADVAHADNEDRIEHVAAISALSCGPLCCG